MSRYYQPSGSFNPARLALSLALLLGLAGALAAALAVATISGMYYIFAIPAIAMLPLAGAGWALARWSHLRSPYLGVVLGGLLGIIAYVGQYHALLISQAGPAAAVRLDLLPGYTIAAVNQQTIGENGEAGRNDALANWGIFGFELLMCAAISGGVWYLVGWMPYCERCQTWLTTKTTPVSLDSANTLAAALKAGSLADLPVIDPPEELCGTWGELELTGCLHGGSGEDALFFVTVNEAYYDAKNNKRTKAMVNLVSISGDELIQLYDRCPSLQLETYPTEAMPA